MIRLAIQTWIPCFFMFCILNTSNIKSQTITNDYQETFEILKVDPAFSISKNQIKEITSLEEINKHFKPEWVKEYFSVSTIAIIDGKEKRVTSENNLLNSAQKELLKQADVHELVQISINYLPNNSLKENEAKKIHFSFAFIPTIDAAPMQGNTTLANKIKDILNAKDLAYQQEKHQLAIATFSISAEGDPYDVKMVSSTKNSTIDSVIVEQLSCMEKWNPASYANGKATQQDFALLIGDDQSCNINLVNVEQHENFGVLHRK